MALTITDSFIESDVTRHTAMKGHDGWTVSWLHGGLDRNAAITAMTLAQMVAQYEHNTPGGQVLARGLAAELGIPTVTDAVRLIEKDQDHRYVRRVKSEEA
jgi:hypothetical protein